MNQTRFDHLCSSPDAGSSPSPPSSGLTDLSFLRYQRERSAHWDSVAEWRGGGYAAAYRNRLSEVYSLLVPPGRRVLEVGCAQGDLLASLAPSFGVGLDFSRKMIERAKRKHPALEFVQADAHSFELDGEFDVIILSDVVNDLWDVEKVFRRLARVSTPRTRVVLNFFSRLWELPLAATRRLGLSRRNLPQNWLTVEDVTALLSLAEFEVICHREEVLLPLSLPPLSTLANRYLVKLRPFRLLALSHFLVARLNRREPPGRHPKVSVVVPVRNEAGNIPDVFARTPELGAGTELIFVEGGSSDNSYEVVEAEMARNPGRPCKLLRQTGAGKGDAVRLGFAHASGDVLMILDSDLTVPPEELPRFLEALTLGKAELVNGSRLVYPMEKDAMRFFNLLGNKFFGLSFAWVLGQPIKDTLCGTKALWKSDYEAIAANRSYFGDFDPFGDFDLLFGAAKLNLKILDLPIRYRERVYGTTQIRRWHHGLLLLRMLLFAARQLKFT